MESKKKGSSKSKKAKSQKGVTKRPKLRIQRNWFMTTTGLPTTLNVLFKYVVAGNEQPATTAVKSNQFRLNGCYNVDVTNVQGSPRYYDQLCALALYNVNHVNSVRWAVTFINKGSHDAQVGLTTGGPNTSIATSAAGLFTHQELKGTTVRTITSVGINKSKITLTGRSQVWPLVATSKLQYQASRTNYSHNYNGTPTVPAYLWTLVSDDANGSAGANVDVYINIWFACTLSQLARDISQS